MTLGYIGLGKMGLNMIKRLVGKGHNVVAYDLNKNAMIAAEACGASVAESPAKMASSLEAPRVIWLMLPHSVVDEMIESLEPYLAPGDVLIDGGNSFYVDSAERAKKLAKKGIKIMDVGTSGGPSGALEGACLMIGGDKEVYVKYKSLFEDIAAPETYGYMGKSGAGHFAKMVHNGIEYGMMQAIGEGFEIMKKSEFDLNLQEVARVYNHRSVIESRLVGWLERAFQEQGADLKNISGEVAHTGEGKWTVEEAKKLGVPAPVIEAAFNFRIKSQNNPSYAGKVVSALRGQFGGHSVKNN